MNAFCVYGSARQKKKEWEVLRLFALNTLIQHIFF